MAEDVQVDVLRRTQESLGKFIKKPVLSEKLLRKPPFRFLHDICTAAMKETGFLEDTLSGNDIKIELITDKEGKIAFLQKVIAAVEAANDVKLGVKPTKIVAGHEPMKTNEFLQALANALEKKVGSKPEKKAVKKTKPSNDKKEEETVKRKNVANKPSNKTSEQPPPQDPKRDDKKRKSTDKKIEKAEETRRKVGKEKSVTKTKDKPSKKNVEVEKVENAMTNGVAATEEIKAEEVIVNGAAEETKNEEDDAENKQTRPVSAKYKKRKASARHPPDPTLTTTAQQESNPDHVLGDLVNDLPHTPPTPSVTTSPDAPDLNVASTTNDVTNDEVASNDTPAARGPSAAPKPEPSTRAPTRGATPLASAISNRRPPSSVPVDGPAPLKATAPIAVALASNVSDSSAKEAVAPQRPRTAIRPPSARPASARPAAPRVRDRGQLPLQEEVLKPVGKVNLIVEQESQQDDEELVTVQSEQTAELVVDTTSPFSAVQEASEHGQLVNQILEAQKKLEDDAFAKRGANNRTEIEWSSGRGLEATRRDVEKMRSAVQSVTRSANPLGKLLEYLQDDVDSMQQELHQWRDRNATLSASMEQEKNLTDKSIEPLKTHLVELEESIRTEMEQIGALKATILRNDDRINRLLTSL